MGNNKAIANSLIVIAQESTVTQSQLPTLDPLTEDHSSDERENLIQSDIDITVRKIESRQRQIEAKIQLPYSADQVWQVLTDYEALPEFIPNLERSQRLDHPDGGIRIEQVGAQSALMVKFSARVVLDMEENFPEVLNFDMVEGDFKAFGGEWRLAPSSSDQASTELTYSVKVWPKRTMPILAVEKRLAKDLPTNLQAIRQRLDDLYGAEASQVA